MELQNITLDSLDGAGTKTILKLKEKGINNCLDLLNFFPTRYSFYSLDELKSDEPITIEGVITSNPISKIIRRNLSLTSFNISTNDKIIKVTIFNRHFLANQLTLERKIYVHGTLDKDRFTASDIFFEFSKDKSTAIYSDLGVSNYLISKLIKSLFDKFGFLIKENMPDTLTCKYKLLDLYEAYRCIHMPQNKKEVNAAQRRFKFQEIFDFELKMKFYQKNQRIEYKEPKIYSINKVKEFISTIPFELTEDQKSVTNEIFKDLKKPYSANRLIQGDVGSGKTIVATIAIYATITSGYQSALMAPTEVLALQHYQTIRNILPSASIILLTSNMKGSKRIEAIKKIYDASVVIGTHSLIQDDVAFRKLGLVIIDEQHRFGVNQRTALRDKGENPDCLFLSATPIPRTLAISVFGDLDVSSIRTKPKGRISVKTYCLSNKKAEKMNSFIASHLEKNEQAYFIAPLVEESKKLDLENVMALYEKTKENFPNYRVSLVHGKMSFIEKEQALLDFKEHKADILVSTTVIEVGVDVYDATIMVIFDAHRFGLSQLHQLRGRVGRNSKECFCFLVSDYENTKRLSIMEKTNDGFLLSEEDLKLRGPGDFFGTRQSGLPSFRFIDFSKDINVIATARDEAVRLCNSYYEDTLEEEEKNYLIKKQIINLQLLD